jgi:hypothetical protein
MSGVRFIEKLNHQAAQSSFPSLDSSLMRLANHNLAYNVINVQRGRFDSPASFCALQPQP